MTMIFPRRILRQAVLAGFIFIACAASSPAWWNKDWSGRKAFTVDTGAEAGAISEPIGGAVMLVRLHQGNFAFEMAKEDGSDIRFVSEDDKTVLPHQIEKFDSLLTEAFVWVKVPEVKPGGQTKFWLYYGNGGEMEAVPAAKTYDDDTVLVYHFAEKGAPAADASSYGNKAETAGSPSDGSMIGSGIRLLGNAPITIPASDSMKWNPGSSMTWSAWIKPGALQPNAVIFNRKEEGNSFSIGLDQGVPYVEVTDASGTTRSAAGEALAVNSWKHLAVVSDGVKIDLVVDGELYGSLNSALPAMNGTALIGGDGTDALGFSGELDELEISRVGRPTGFIKLAAISQGGSDRASKLLAAGEDEGSGGGGLGDSEAIKHVMLFGDIAKNMMFDGWIAIVVCVIMMIAGWSVAVKKYVILGKIKKGSAEFERQWKAVASDLTVLDTNDSEASKNFGGKADKKTLRLMRDSPLYHVYQIGAEEIRHRLGDGKNTGQGLSARSIQAIRAALDAGLVREHHSLNKGIVLLTISIAGGPYVGLLGTVVGVMITFAIIAKSGNVEINSIAPGIASALLATVVGLLVAIPALFMYSYLASRIKETLASMQVFIDEFIAKVAEFYPPPGERTLPVAIQQIRRPEDAARAHEAIQAEISEQSRSK